MLQRTLLLQHMGSSVEFSNQATAAAKPSWAFGCERLKFPVINAPSILGPSIPPTIDWPAHFFAASSS